MAISIQGQVAVITGASRGIGRATALALAKAGCHIAATARDAAALEALVAECTALGVRAKAYSADATDAQAVYAVRDQVLADFGQVDTLVNNAGVARYASLVEHTVEDYDWMMNSNMRSTFLFTHAFVPSMIARKQGNVIVVSSQAGVHGFPNEAVYCATKHAQVGFATALDGELRPHGVRVTIIAPGGVRTTFAFGTGRTADMPALQEMIEAEDVAEAIVFAVQMPAKSRVLMIGMRPMSEKLYGGA
ncbi:MAG: short-chain dehydrogenase [Candidatus Thermofonsia Clade 1 bacterium]|jgi:3-oxoacyl-[acyl-carrier protein] reductase|uniref:Short-chain dehydrogenase n=1 Tax=Candidatus Thermofonsia Clade 1 bacterium TaxID=2364210 RepID=A0A2M8PFN0_9CHLR|nr:MAG: short-chain dehydrogenase [Candidatus Thermofonsia Clade 1 bacterium]RMF53044.1 MAG: SDR family oxidoreductase [Chloroflexota bacterium]